MKYTEQEFKSLLHLAEQRNVTVEFFPFEANKGMLYGDGRTVIIGNKTGMEIDESVYSLAHELAHYFLHYDKGDTIKSEKHKKYEEQADRAAKMLLAALDVMQKGGAA